MEVLINTIEKIIILQTAFIGDCILTLPLIQKLKEKYPDSEIDVITIPKSKEIFESSPFVNNVIVLDKKGKHRSILSIIKFAKELKKKNYTKLISPHRSFRSALITIFSGINDTYGFNTSSIPFAYRATVHYDYKSHEVKRNLSFVDNCEYEKWKVLPIIKCSNESLQKINEFITSLKSEKLIAISPGSEWMTKKYPSKYYSKVIQHLVEKEYKIILIGSNREMELCNEVRSGLEENVINSAGKFTIPESVELLRHCKLLVTNDSAPTHMGMAAGIKVLTIYVSTVPGFGFYPYSNGSDYISLEVKCKPCGIHGYNECPLNHFDCGKNLLPETIINKIEDMLR